MPRLNTTAKRIAVIVLAGAAIGAICNELGPGPRVPYFGFSKAGTLQARLAESVEQTAPTSEPSPQSSNRQPLKVILFFAECDECKIVHEQVLPKIEKLFGDRVEVQQFDCADMANYKRLLEYEKRYGSDENEMLKLFIGDRHYLAGAAAIASRAIPLIRQELSVTAERTVDE